MSEPVTIGSKNVKTQKLKYKIAPLLSDRIIYINATMLLQAIQPYSQELR